MSRRSSVTTLVLSEQSSLDLSILTELGAELATKWNKVGDCLGVPSHELRAIQANNHGHPDMVQNCLREVLSWWIRNGKVVTAEKLAEAAHANDEHSVEARIKKRYGECEVKLLTTL